MKYIKLFSGEKVKVDDEDYDGLAKYNWRKTNNYAARHGGTGVTIYMHRQIMDTPYGLQTDHINHDKFDNRKSNLRVVTVTQNRWNMKRPRNTIKRKVISPYKGVSIHIDQSRKLRWRARIMVNKKEISLGYFSTPEEAHIAYCAAAERYFKEFAFTG